jgi:hypothetical protein
MEPVELFDLLPWGNACFEFEASDNLRHPKLFIDPQSGNPHVFATDLASCHFQILELIPVFEELDRNFQIIILRHASMIALRPDLPLKSGNLEVGTGLKIVMHWDDVEESLLYYLELDPQGASEPKALALDENLNHEQAVSLIRELAKR